MMGDGNSAFGRARVAMLCIAVLLAIVFLETGSCGALAAAGFSRGIAIAHVLGWADVEPAPSAQFVVPPFRDSGRSLSRDELVALRRVGFDFVRLAVDPGPFLDFEGARRDALDALLADRVRQILSSGLSVVVDFHPSDSNARYTGEALAAGVHTSLFQSYLGLLGRTASLLAPIAPGRVALEIMNEPVVRTNAWQPMLEAGYAAVRARAPDLPVIVSGGDEGSADGLMQVATRAFRDDAGVLFSFHFYDPYQFTHQGAPWNPARYLADVPYPANARPLEETVRATNDAIEAAHLAPSAARDARADALNRLMSYRRSGFGHDTIAQTFARVARWAEGNGIPLSRVLLGEFGAIRTERQRAGPAATERANWLRDVREEAERRGFGWAVWVYRGSGGFALVAPQSDTVLDPGIAAALGLAAQPGSK